MAKFNAFKNYIHNTSQSDLNASSMIQLLDDCECDDEQLDIERFKQVLNNLLTDYNAIEQSDDNYDPLTDDQKALVVCKLIELNLWCDDNLLSHSIKPVFMAKFDAFKNYIDTTEKGDLNVSNVVLLLDDCGCDDEQLDIKLDIKKIQKFRNSLNDLLKLKNSNDIEQSDDDDYGPLTDEQKALVVCKLIELNLWCDDILLSHSNNQVLQYIFDNSDKYTDFNNLISKVVISILQKTKTLEESTLEELYVKKHCDHIPIPILHALMLHWKTTIPFDDMKDFIQDIINDFPKLLTQYCEIYISYYSGNYYYKSCTKLVKFDIIAGMFMNNNYNNNTEKALQFFLNDNNRNIISKNCNVKTIISKELIPTISSKALINFHSELSELISGFDKINYLYTPTSSGTTILDELQDYSNIDKNWSLSDKLVNTTILPNSKNNTFIKNYILKAEYYAIPYINDILLKHVIISNYCHNYANDINNLKYLINKYCVSETPVVQEKNGGISIKYLSKDTAEKISTFSDKFQSTPDRDNNYQLIIPKSANRSVGIYEKYLQGLACNTVSLGLHKTCELMHILKTLGIDIYIIASPAIFFKNTNREYYKHKQVPNVQDCILYEKIENDSSYDLDVIGNNENNNLAYSDM